jgi:hypothetical protein
MSTAVVRGAGVFVPAAASAAGVQQQRKQRTAAPQAAYKVASGAASVLSINPARSVVRLRLCTTEAPLSEKKQALTVPKHLLDCSGGAARTSARAHATRGSRLIGCSSAGHAVVLSGSAAHEKVCHRLPSFRTLLTPLTTGCSQRSGFDVYEALNGAGSRRAGFLVLDC